MTIESCNETVLTIFANLTPWVQSVIIIGFFAAIMGVCYLFSRRPVQEHVHYVASGMPE